MCGGLGRLARVVVCGRAHGTWRHGSQAWKGRVSLLYRYFSASARDGSSGGTATYRFTKLMFIHTQALFRQVGCRTKKFFGTQLLTPLELIAQRGGEGEFEIYQRWPVGERMQ